MGQFLEVSIAMRLIVSKTDRRWSKSYTMEQIKAELGKMINLDLYELEKEDDAYLHWQIKKDVFAENIYEFLLEQSLLYDRTLPQDLAKLLQTKDYDQILETAKDKRYCEFQMVDSIGEYHYLMENVQVYGETILFFMEGKAYLECYYKLFRYMGNLIRRASQNKLKDTVVIALN